MQRIRRWQMDGHGRDRLTLVEAHLPPPRGTQVQVAVQAVSMNYRDTLMIRDGMGMRLPMPFTPGSDLSGVVVAVGEQVTRVRLGDAVIGSFWAGWIDGSRPPHAMPLGGPGPGALASHVLLDEQWVVRRPRTISPAQASTLPCAGLTAWTALVEVGHLHAGQTVLIHGTGGVALFGLQLARMHGAQAIVVTGSARKHERVRELGATHVLPRDDGRWVQAVRELTGQRGADHVLETAGGANVGRSVEASAEHGRVAVIGMIDGTELRLPFYALIGARASVHGIGVGHRRGLEDLVRAAEITGLAPVIEREYAFAELMPALDHLERGGFGKLVLRMDA